MSSTTKGSTRGSVEKRCAIVYWSSVRIGEAGPPRSRAAFAVAYSDRKRIIDQAANNPTSSSPGPMPARNRRPSDCSAATAYRIMVMDGGSRIPRVPPAAMIPAAKPGE